jgi:diaminopimelate decarboxylase
MTTGAYGAVMASNYNGRLKPAEILIKENQVFVIKEREDFDSLIKNEKLIN